MHKKTPEAFKHNVKAEIEAGKPPKQAVAIAYSEKASAEHKKHLAEGGKVDGCPECEKIPESEANDNESDPDVEMHDMVGREMMEHIHSKNHKGLMDSLKAAIALHANKKDESDELE